MMCEATIFVLFLFYIINIKNNKEVVNAFQDKDKTKYSRCMPPEILGGGPPPLPVYLIIFYLYDIISYIYIIFCTTRLRDIIYLILKPYYRSMGYALWGREFTSRTSLTPFPPPPPPYVPPPPSPLLVLLLPSLFLSLLKSYSRSRLSNNNM